MGVSLSPIATSSSTAVGRGHFRDGSARLIGVALHGIAIADFGGSVRLGRELTGGAPDSSRTLGTPAYMAPEACRGDAITAA